MPKKVEPAHVRMWPHDPNATSIVVPRAWTPEEAMTDALSKHPDCTYADWTPELDMLLNDVICVKLWRNEECWMNDDPPRYTIGSYYR